MLQTDFVIATTVPENAPIISRPRIETHETVSVTTKYLMKASRSIDRSVIGTNTEPNESGYPIGRHHGEMLQRQQRMNESEMKSNKYSNCLLIIVTVLPVNDDYTETRNKCKEQRAHTRALSVFTVRGPWHALSCY
jgi:hypothetical protein